MYIAVPINHHKEPRKTESRARKCAFFFAEYWVKHSTCTSYLQRHKQLSSHLDAKQDAAALLRNQEHCYFHRLQDSLILFYHFSIYWFDANFFKGTMLKWVKRDRETNLYLSHALYCLVLLMASRELEHVSYDKPQHKIHFINTEKKQKSTLLLMALPSLPHWVSACF